MRHATEQCVYNIVCTLCGIGTDQPIRLVDWIVTVRISCACTSMYSVRFRRTSRTSCHRMNTAYLLLQHFNMQFVHVFVARVVSAAYDQSVSSFLSRIGVTAWFGSAPSSIDCIRNKIVHNRCGLIDRQRCNRREWQNKTKHRFNAVKVTDVLMATATVTAETVCGLRNIRSISVPFSMVELNSIESNSKRNLKVWICTFGIAFNTFRFRK